MPARATLLTRLERTALGATRALSVVGLAALMVLACLTLANGLLRWLINQPIAGVVDLGALAIALAVSCCLPVALIERTHVTFRVVATLSPRLGRLFDLAAAIAVEAVLVLMALQFSSYAAGLVQSGETTYVLKWPTAPFWYGVDAVLWCAVIVQAIVILTEMGRLAAPAASAAP